MNPPLNQETNSNLTEFNENDDLIIYFDNFKRKMEKSGKKVIRPCHIKEGLWFCHIKVMKYHRVLITYKSDIGQETEIKAKLCAIKVLKKEKSKIIKKPNKVKRVIKILFKKIIKRKKAA